VWAIPAMMRSIFFAPTRIFQGGSGKASDQTWDRGGQASTGPCSAVGAEVTEIGRDQQQPTISMPAYVQ
jgi:hypothetical protein